RCITDPQCFEALRSNCPTKPRKIDKIEKESRLLAVEELIASGIGSARVERELAGASASRPVKYASTLPRCDAVGMQSLRRRLPTVERNSSAWPNASTPRTASARPMAPF